MNEFTDISEIYGLWVLLAQTRDAIFKSRESELKQYKVTPMQAAVLFSIQVLGDKATPVAIGRRLFRQRNSISEILDRMERIGLVRKVNDLSRKKRVRAVLTDRGRKVYHLLSSETVSLYNIMSSLSEKEQQRLGSYLQILRARALKELEKS